MLKETTQKDHQLYIINENIKIGRGEREGEGERERERERETDRVYMWKYICITVSEYIGLTFILQLCVCTCGHTAVW